jgi:hypothetical protein
MLKISVRIKSGGLVALEALASDVEQAGFFDFLRGFTKEEKTEMVEDLSRKLKVKLTKLGNAKHGLEPRYSVVGDSGTIYLTNVSKEKATNYAVRINMKMNKIAGPAGHSAHASTAKPIDKDKLNDKILSKLVDQIAKMAESHDFSGDTWNKVLEELSIKGKKKKK